MILLSHQSCLASETITPLSSPRRMESLVRWAPSTFFLTRHSPVNTKFIRFIWVSCDNIYCENMLLHIFLSLFCVIIKIHAFIIFRWSMLSRVIYVTFAVKSWFSILLLLTLLLLKLIWEVWSIIRKFLSICSKCLMSNKHMHSTTITNEHLLLQVIGILLDKLQSFSERVGHCNLWIGLQVWRRFDGLLAFW